MKDAEERPRPDRDAIHMELEAMRISFHMLLPLDGEQRQRVLGAILCLLGISKIEVSQ